MLNVNKVKTLSERTSGVPPVIFNFDFLFSETKNYDTSLDFLANSKTLLFNHSIFKDIWYFGRLSTLVI